MPGPGDGAQAYQTWYPTDLTGFPAAVNDASQVLDIYHEIDDETSTEALGPFTVTVPADPCLIRFNDAFGDMDSFECWDTYNKSGDQMTNKPWDADFDGSDEVKFEPFGNRVQFSTDQATLTRYIWFNASHSVMDAYRLSRMESDIVAMMTKINAISPEALWTQTSETVVDESAGVLDYKLGYIAESGGVVYVIRLVDADLSDLAKMQAACLVLEDTSNGATIDVVNFGRVEIPGGLGTDPPIGTALYAGRNGELTWDNDTSANKLVAGDWFKYIGHRRDDTYIDINLYTPVMLQR